MMPEATNPVTKWVDGRIQVGVQAAVEALLDHEDEILTKAAAKFRDAILGDFHSVGKQLEALPNLVSSLEQAGLNTLAAGLHGLEAIPQQTAAQIETGLQQTSAQLRNLIAAIPGQITQAIGGLFPHFLTDLATLPPTERDTLIRNHAAEAAKKAERAGQVREPENDH